MNNNILFAIPTAEEHAPRNINDFNKAYSRSTDFYTKTNKGSLLKFFMDMRKEHNHYESFDYIICMHDDVWLRDNMFEVITREAFDKFDYWGVAGTNIMLPSNPRWHVPLGSAKYLSGHMEHQLPNADGKFMTSFGSYPAPCAIFDGVFMAWKREVFDVLVDVPELDGFHMYDMEMCTQAWEKGFKGGVVGLNLSHESRGEGILTSDWEKYAKIYSQRWSKYKIIGGKNV